MARRVFFSFNYEEDVWRANQVRNCWMTQPDHQEAGFFDASLWEKAKQSDEAIKRMIRDGLQNTTVTAILVGANTANRTYIDYEIDQSYQRGNGLLAIYINGLNIPGGVTSARGINPLDTWTWKESGRKFSDHYATYDWARDDGYKNCGDWFERAARQAGK